MGGDRKKLPRRQRSRIIVWGTVLALGAGTALAIQIAVDVSAIELFSKKSGMSKILGTADKGAQLEVIATEGDWLKVKSPNGLVGYVKKANLSKPSLNAGGRPLSGDAKSSGGAAALAAKGIEPTANDFAKDQKISPSSVNELNRMLGLRDSITPEEYDKFLTDGGLAPK